MATMIFGFHGVARLWAMRICLAVALLAALSGRSEAASCTASVNALNFGTVNLLSSSNTDVQTTVFINCSVITPGFTVKMCPSINIGTGGWNGTSRTMIGPSSAKLTFLLYQDAGYSQLWGSLATPALGTIPLVSFKGDINGNGSATLTLYGRVAGGQYSVLPGSYTSHFAGTDAQFRYSEVTGSLGTCAGFNGTAVTSPSFDIVAAPPSACIFSVSDLNFPTSTQLKAAVNGQTSLSATCTAQTTYSVAFDNGLNGSSPTARQMKSAASDLVTYGLYRDSAYSQPWGTVASGQAASGTGVGTAQPYTVYGQVPAQPLAKPGTYTDRIVVTVAY